MDHNLRTYLHLLWGQRAIALTALVSALGKSLAAAAFALTLRQMLESLIHGHKPWTAIAEAIVISLLVTAFSLGNRFSVILLTQNLLQNLRRDLVAKLMILSPRSVGKRGRADLLNVIVQDTERLDRMTTSLVGSIIPSVLLIIGYLVALLMVSPLFGLVSVSIGVLFWICHYLMRSKITIHANRYTAAMAQFNRGVLLTIERLGIIRVGTLRQTETAERAGDLRDLHRIAMSTDQAIGSISEIAGLMGNIATVLLILCAALISESSVVFVDIMTAYLLLFMIRSQVAATGATLPDLKFGMAAFDRIRQLLDEPGSRPYSGTRKIAFGGNLEMRNVAFHFEGAPLFSHLDLRIARGEKVVVTGPNGSGKTTLLNLLLGIYRPDSGSVLAEGVSYEELDLSSLLADVGYIPQEPVIFAASIADNIGYGHPAATPQQIADAARLTGADEFITRLPDGYDTQVGDMGLFLSGGQRQRIALARAMLGRPNLLILDEPTNHLDHGALSTLLSAVGDAGRPLTALIITHDKALLAMADKVFNLQHGVLHEIVDMAAIPGLPDVRVS